MALLGLGSPSVLSIEPIFKLLVSLDFAIPYKHFDILHKSVDPRGAGICVLLENTAATLSAYKNRRFFDENDFAFQVELSRYRDAEARQQQLLTLQSCSDCRRGWTSPARSPAQGPTQLMPWKRQADGPGPKCRRPPPLRLGDYLQIALVLIRVRFCFGRAAIQNVFPDERCAMAQMHSSDSPIHEQQVG
ncbi:hypothetical protein NPIL_279741 [Nephila pilipes]|uniref:Uncharacterized protein n=1 Tax=Nephila pilipes TaxID=299642 RepID=A0A8X6PS77_NEPPI|nr:hypothetical protein NPIL_279741 [Nephila pilipes]